MDFRIVVLISGRGSNMASLAEKAQKYRIAAVVSNNPDAMGLRYASDQGIEVVVVPRSEHASVAAQKAEICSVLRRLDPDLIALAGYMQIVPGSFVRDFFGKLLNIHPSLLPKYPGLEPHAQALAAGEKEHGCTVHFVDGGVDTGPVVAQAKVPVLPGDSADTLAARVLEQEHVLYPWVVNQIACGKISLEGTTVCYTDETRKDAAKLGFHLPY